MLVNIPINREEHDEIKILSIKKRTEIKLLVAKWVLEGLSRDKE